MPFNPTDATKALLTSAVREAGAWLEQSTMRACPRSFSDEPLDVPGAAGSHQRRRSRATPTRTSIRPTAGAWPTATPYIGIKRLGAGQFYTISIRDKDGDAFDGAKTYRLNVPPNAPVEQYWSVTAYDRQTHALIKGMPRASRSSQIPELQKNADGSIDIYLGPKAPAGKDANWLPTDPARKFELMARFYGPKPEFFEKKWVLPDVEKVAAQ